MIIAGAANHRNRHFTGEASPVAPVMKMSQIVGAHQPNVAVFGETLLEPLDRIDRKSCALSRFEIADPDRRAPRHPPGRCQPSLEWRHILGAFLQRVAGRYQPPDFIEAECFDRVQADRAMPLVRGVERAAKKTDASHAVPLA